MSATNLTKVAVLGMMISLETDNDESGRELENSLSGLNLLELSLLRDAAVRLCAAAFEVQERRKELGRARSRDH